MITSIARQAVILKCLRKRSVLVGNYEFHYLAGLMKQLFDLPLEETMSPAEMSSLILDRLPDLKPKNEEEEYLIRLVSVYETEDRQDDQMKELFRWGCREKDVWKVNTSHSGEEYGEGR